MKLRVIAAALMAVLFMPGCVAGATRQTESAITPAANRVTVPTQAGTISAEQAQNIALEHAGFTADQVRWLRTEYEVDDGVARYEVQFRQGRWEYDYEINAATGAILSYDRDD